MPATSTPFMLAAALLPLAMAAAPSALAAEALSVTIDQAKVMHISRPADVVIIGNPGIADATIQDQQTLIITGRSFGQTNLIVLDSTGKAIAEEMLSVQPANDGVVTMYKTADKRITRETFSCTPDCSPTLSIGDAETAFNRSNTQITQRATFSQGATK